MEALLLLGLVLFVALWVGVLMYRLRGGKLWSPPLWILAVFVSVLVAILIFAILMRSWWSVVTFSLMTVAYGLILLQALRARRST